MQGKANILLLLTVMSILIAGCQLVNPRDNGIPDSSSAFEGKEGLVLSFFDNAPPDNLFPNSEFKIAVLLENKGAADINCTENDEDCGYFLAFSKEPITNITPSTGFLKDALEKIDDQYKILGKESYLSGGRAAMEFSAKVGEPDKTTTSTITVNACYPYKTYLSTSICVQTAHYTVPEENLACYLKTLTFSDQGAPVAITKIEQESILSGEYVKPHLKIYVSEVAKGTVLDGYTDSLKKACTADAANFEDIIGIVKIREATLSGEKLDCKGKTITLSGMPKNDFVDCTLEGNVFKAGAANNLVSPLKIVLSYGYQTAISKEVKIEVIDSPPKIKRFSITPEKPKPNDKLNIFIAAEDDTGIKTIQLLNNDGELISEHLCDGKASCENTFTVTPTGAGDAPGAVNTYKAQAGEAYTYKAMAVDTSGKQSDIKTMSGAVGGIVVKIELPDKAAAGSDIQIAATATSAYTRLKLIELLNDKGLIIDEYLCPFENTCTHTFTQKAPAEGKTYSYKVRATDSAGATQESDLKEGTATA